MSGKVIPSPSWGQGNGMAVPPLLSVAVPVSLVGLGIAWVYRRKLLCLAFDRVAAAGGKKGHKFLAGQFEPVHDEVFSEDLPVEGELPAELEGALVRTGPNPYFNPVGSIHLFDGDGMLHAVRIKKGGKASYCNHFIQTARLEQEKAASAPLFLKMGDTVGARGLLLLMLSYFKKLLGVMSDADGHGTANTALVYHAQRLLSLHEADLPYQVRVLCNGVLETVGRLKLGGPGSSTTGAAAYPGPFSAHPKMDPATGELFFFGYSLDVKPFMRGGMMDAQGQVTKQWAVDLPYATMMHDCALTPTYAVILHLPLVFEPKEIMKGSLPLTFDATKRSRIGLLRRDSPGCEGAVTDPNARPATVQWFEMPAFMVFHVAGSWEDMEGRVHVVACHFPEFSFFKDDASTKTTPESEKQRIFEYVLNPMTGEHTMTQRSSVQCDFPVIHPSRATRRPRYIWAATFSDIETVATTGIAKFDLDLAGDEACSARIEFEPGCSGGEAVFVPRDQSGGHVDPATEDDGWLLVFVNDASNASTGITSSLHIYDARTMSRTLVAKIALPQRVPAGFHGMWLTETQLRQQLAGGRPSVDESSEASPLMSHNVMMNRDSIDRFSIDRDSVDRARNERASTDRG